MLISLTSLKSKRTRLHRGEILANIVNASHHRKENLASKAGYSRSSYYKHIANPDLDFHILIRYGKALRHDFTEEFPEMPKYLLEDPEENYGKPPNLDEAIRQRDYWKDKYLDLLEKYNRQIEERMQK